MTGAATDLLPPGLELSAPKRRLYEKAMELFGTHGYHAVSIRDIAQALGLQPSTLYVHVPSKQQLLFELAKLGHETHLGKVRGALLDAGDDPVDQLRAVVTAHVRGHLEYPAMARLTNRELGGLSEEQLTTVLALRQQIEQVVVDVLERGVRRGAFTLTDTFLGSKAIGAMGIRVPEWFGPDSPRTPDQVVEQYVGFALKLVQ